MNKTGKTKRRGFVMTGGGAKGLFEAGVIHAFHITGMEFDVITGSSIGAMNSTFFAEYLLRKRELPAEVRADPERTIQAMDGLIRSYHRAWLLMPEKKIIDDSPNSPLGTLVDDLGKFKSDPGESRPDRLVVERSRNGALSPAPRLFQRCCTPVKN